MIPIKIICHCGQKYAFDVQPVDGRMPVPVYCPACGRDGTAPPTSPSAKFFTARRSRAAGQRQGAFEGRAAQPRVASGRGAQGRRGAGTGEQRRALLAAQQQAAAELTELARRLEAVQTPMLERLRAYEQRIAELEKELAEQSKENRELLKLKIDCCASRLKRSAATAGSISTESMIDDL